MNSPLCLWLADFEEGCWLMIRGVFRFTFIRLPEWFYRTLLDTVGPATIRLIRVLVVFCLWLAVMFGPAVGAIKFKLPFWGGVGAAAWVALAIIGSVWGRACLARKRRAAAKAAEANSLCLDGLSSRRECVVHS
jgi:hypothetical protein